ncbi:MAG: hypothetical protein KDK70_19740, partial [Myxococcales bacterium]|nr:hypothetical protein [Myxococcales bacterium]
MSGVARVHPGCALGLSLTLLVGCREPDPPLLVAKPGCGIEDGLIDNLRVKARGDFPDGSGTEVRLSGGTQTLAWGDRPVVGVTVEGLFGGAVEAVGRTARLHEDGDIPVYFARVDGLCPVDDDDAAPREAVAAAVGPLGDVVLAGGSGVLGSPRDDVLHLHDEEGTLRVLPGRLPVPVVGQSVHAIDERRFLMVGGAASDGQVRAEVVLIDLDDDDAPVGEPVPVPVSIEQGPARAHHAAAVSPGGTVLLAGGCQRVDAALGCPTESESDPHVDGPAVLGTSLWIDPHDGLDFGPGPALEVPRFGATLMFARDGVAFLAGGRDALGVPVHVVERRRPGDSVFGVYGAPDPSAPIDTTPVVGSALLEGGVVVLVLEDGRVLWVNERGRGEFPGWCDGTGPCFDLVAPRRGVIALPGERVLIDGIVLPVGSVGLDG